MKIAWSSDVHLNFIDEDKVLKWMEEFQGADAIFLTGDIAESGDILYWLEFMASRFKNDIYFVLGNHDYYRSSIPKVRKLVGDLSHKTLNLHFLNQDDHHQLTSSISLIGHDGWGDAKNGDFLQTPMRMNDHELIEDLVHVSREQLQLKLQELGEEAAAHIQECLEKAKNTSKEIWVLTHVPPFTETCWYNAGIAPESWMPDCTCQSVGDVLLEFCDENPDVLVKVFCGHGHSPGEVWVKRNLFVRTARAEYEYPVVEALMVIPEWKK